MAINESFEVVAVCFNPAHHASRFRLFKEFQEHMKRAGVRLISVEVAFGSHDYYVTEANNQDHLQLRTWFPMFIKENALNIGIQRSEADLIGWFDADTSFTNPDWVDRTKQSLQYWKVIQPWSFCVDLGPKNQVMFSCSSFCYRWRQSTDPFPREWRGMMDEPPQKPYFFGGHPGLAWAIRREALEEVGGLYEDDVFGGGDFFMSRAFIGDVKSGLEGILKNSKFKGDYLKFTDSYRASVMRWAERCDEYIKQDVGFADNLINHHWHGKKQERQYDTKWAIVIENEFDPVKHLKKDPQGLWQFTHHVSPRLRDGILNYALSRNEDSTDI